MIRVVGAHGVSFDTVLKENLSLFFEHHEVD